MCYFQHLEVRVCTVLDVYNVCVISQKPEHVVVRHPATGLEKGEGGGQHVRVRAVVPVMDSGREDGVLIIYISYIYCLVPNPAAPRLFDNVVFWLFSLYFGSSTMSLILVSTVGEYHSTVVYTL